MNKVFKTKWSAALQQYVVTDETKTTHSKNSHKGALVVAVASALATFAGCASAGYISSHGYIEDLKAPLETQEYQMDWGLDAMNASSAYALGYTGKGVAVGVMDSGALMQKHSDLSGNRFHAVKVDGLSYGSTGNRYPQHNPENGEDLGHYKPGATVPPDGNWVKGMNDSHGTHVTGTVGGKRDGNEFHGVAYESDVYVGNTGGTDDTNYGPFQDPQFFYQTWNAIASQLNEANHGRGGFINNSFGTNIRVKQDKDGTIYGPDGGNITVHFPTDTVSQTEYEYFLFMKDAKNRENSDHRWNNKSFVDAAFEAVKDKKVVQVFTTGNRDFNNPFYRPLYPYFNPEAEPYWVAVAGMKRDGKGGYTFYDTFNEAGNAKWWTVAAPGENIYSSMVDSNGNPYCGNSSGTSMAAPHVTGALAVLMSRYPQMDALQVRDVMLTTATHKNVDGTDFEGWKNHDGTTPKEGEVSDRMGWGMPDLEKGMFGPGQFLGEFNYNMRDENGEPDVWTNDISQVALDQRKREDAAWKVAAEKWLNNDELSKEELELIGDFDKSLDSEGFEIIGFGNDKDKDKIDRGDAENWRRAYFNKRIEAINARANLEGSLIKDGPGTLYMTGNNTYRGETTVKGGTLYAFAESIGENQDHLVTVESGATFGLLASYFDDYTKTGLHQSTETKKGELTLDMKSGSTLYIPAGTDLTINKVDFVYSRNELLADTHLTLKIGLEGASIDSLLKAYKEGSVTGTFEITNGGLNYFGEPVIVDNDSYIFFDKVGKDQIKVEGNKVTSTIKRKEGETISNYASTRAEKEIAAALENSSSTLTNTILLAKKDEDVTKVIGALTDDMYASARNALVVDSLTLTNTVTEQARGIGEGRQAEFDGGRGRVWSVGVGSWGTADGETNSADVDFTAGLFGAELNVCSATKIGAYIGAGSTNVYGKFGKIDGEDRHYGIYGLTDFMGASFTYGVGYTTQERDTKHITGGESANVHSEDASVLQVFAEASYKFNVGAATIDPYVGFNWARVDVDGFNERYRDDTIAHDEIKDDVQVSTLGARFTLPFDVASQTFAVKANAGWSHYFGDTDAVQKIQTGANGQWATLYAKELKDQFNLGLGLEAQLDKRANLGISYVGSFGTDTDMNGAMVNFSMKF